MQQTKAVRCISATILKVVLCLCVLFPVYAHSDSGIALKQNIGIWGTTSDPPPDQMHESFYLLIIENNNDVCDEEVFITATLTPKLIGVSKFLGFTDSPGSPYIGASLHFDLEDEHEKANYFGIETGEDDNGCDFRGFTAAVTICDTGIFGFWGCDSFDDDGLCEAPTPYVQTITQEAGPVTQPEGSGRIYGHVDNIDGDAILAKIFIIKDQYACIPGQPDNIDKFYAEIPTSIYLDPGYFETSGLPYGTYSVAARRYGTLQNQTVTLTSSVPAVQANFTF